MTPIEKIVTGTGYDIWAKVPWTLDTIKVRLLPGGGIEVRWTEQDPVPAGGKDKP